VCDRGLFAPSGFHGGVADGVGGTLLAFWSAWHYGSLMSTRRIPDGLLIAFALPIYQIWHIAKYANTRKRWLAKIGMFITFLPVLVFCSLIWGFLWAVILHLLWRAIS
jgi:hypothetical protein